MKKPYRILSLFLALLLSGLSIPSALAGDDSSQSVDVGMELNGSGHGVPPDPSFANKDGGITANGSGDGVPPEPTIATPTQKLICIQGFCLTIGL